MLILLPLGHSPHPHPHTHTYTHRVRTGLSVLPTGGLHWVLSGFKTLFQQNHLGGLVSILLTCQQAQGTALVLEGHTGMETQF